MTTPAEAPLEAPGIPYVDPHRRQLSRRRARRDGIVASLSTVVAFAVLAYLVTSSPGWPKVQETFFNLDEALAAWPSLVKAFALNIKIFLVAEFFILILSLLIALGRGLRAPVALPVRILCTMYVDFFRGVPTILVILLLGFGVPALQLKGVTNSPVVWGTVALILSYTAYVAEVYRAGIESIHPSQRAAARSLGLSSMQTTRYVVLPQAVRRVTPPLLNDFIALQKETALVSLLGPIEVLRAAQISASSNFNYTAYVVAALFFVAITLPLTRFTDWLQRKDTRRRMAGAVSFVDVAGVHKAFGELAVLKGIDLAVDLHDVVVLIGASGSGKSTLLRCINGLETVDAGQIHVGDLDVTGPGVDVDAVRQRVGIVFQQFNLFPHMSVLQNVTLAPRKVLGQSAAVAEAAAMELLQRFGLAEKAKDFPDRLSGGQQQRVAIVRALAMKPEVMLFDEVTSALDPLLVAEVLDVIRELKAEGMTIVMATHEMGFAREVADRVCFLDSGKVLESGSPDDLFLSPQHEATQLFLARVARADRGL